MTQQPCNKYEHTPTWLLSLNIIEERELLDILLRRD